MELSADFQRLNILLLRAATGKMIGTALLTEVRIHATIGEQDIEASGQLGGLQIMNLLTGSTLHQKIFSVGKDPVTDEYNKSTRDAKNLAMHAELYPQFVEQSSEAQEGQALKFDIVSHRQHMDKDHSINEFKKEMNDEILSPPKIVEVKLRMASVSYLHSASFLEELNSCAIDFKRYMSNLAYSIRSAATDLALGIVSRRTESIGHAYAMDEVYGSTEVYGRNLTPSKSTRSHGIWRTGSFRGSLPHTLAHDYGSIDRRSLKIRAPAPTPRHVPTGSKVDDFHISLDVIMETPIVVIPRHEKSFDVLVAHLGQIIIQNELVDDPIVLQNDPNMPSNSTRLDKIIVKVNDMNIHSLNLSDKIKRRIKANAKGKYEKEEIDQMYVLTELKRMKAEELYSIKSPAMPILHDTAMDLCVNKIQKAATILPKDESYNSFVMTDLDISINNGEENAKERDTYHIRAIIMNALKISLHRSQYEQVLESVRNISNTSDISDQAGPISSNKLDKDVSLDKPETNSSLKMEDNQNLNKEAMSVVEGSFKIPHLMLELRGDMLKQRDNVSSGQGQGLVSLNFHEFAVSYQKSEKHKRTIEVALGSLIMEDLLLSLDSPHRKLATSVSKERKEAPLFGNNVAPGLSSSCPELWYHQIHSELSTSLPNNLDNETLYATNLMNHKDLQHNSQHRNVFYGKKKNLDGETGASEVDICAPATPPPSVCSSRDSPVLNVAFQRDMQNDDNLVHIKILNIERSCPDFVTRHNSTNRFVNVDFNTLDIIFNLQTWVIVLDFFGIGSSPVSRPADVSDSAKNTKKKKHIPTVSRNSTLEGVEKNAQPFNTEIDVKVKSLSVILNRTDYEVASATARNYTSKISLRDNNFAIWGSLGNFSLKDLTSHGLLYKDRISSKRAKQAFNFHLFKFGTPDEKLERPQDATLKIRMSSIIYVHTNRFYSELVTFFNQFHQLHSVTNRMREAAAGSTLNEIATRGSRVKLDIEADSPLLILPMSAFSSQILVINLGRLEIMNVFRFSGEEGTISAERLASAEIGDVLGFRSRARSGSRSSRSSVRSKSSTATRSNVLSTGLNNLNPSSERSRLRSRISIARKGVLSDTGISTDTEDTEIDDKLNTLPSQKEKCLLDVLFVSLRSMDLRTAERLSAFAPEDTLTDEDINVGGFIVHLQPKQVLKEKCELKLQIERNLDKAFNHRVPDLSVKGGLSEVHATIDVQQYMLIRGLLGYNFGECLDDLQFEIPTNEYTDPSLNTILSGHVWTGMFMDIELLNVILDIMTTRPSEDTCLARINLIKSRLIYESFSDSSRDVDLVSQEILLDDLRFQDYPMNKRTNVFRRILQPMPIEILPQRERTSLLQAELHYRSTHDANRFTILLNNMRLMGIFDWWTMVLDFISKSTENPNPPLQKDVRGLKKHQTTQPNLKESSYIAAIEEPLYPTAGIVTRRTNVSKINGPVFELKLNITDSEFIIVADPSQSDSSTVILRSTTVIGYRPDMPEKPFSCNLNNAEVFSCVLSNEDESALSIIDPVTINLEIGLRSDAGNPSKGLLDLAEDQNNHHNVNRVVEVQLQQLNIRLSYHDWLMFQTILESFPRQAREALSKNQNPAKSSNQYYETKQHCLIPPMNTQTQISKLTALGFSRRDCHTALQECNGQIDEAAIWLTQNAMPTVDGENTPETVENFNSENNNGAQMHERKTEMVYLEGSNISFSAIEFKTSSVNICIIDDCKDADVPLIELMLQQLNLKHKYDGKGQASLTTTGSYYNRALSCWEPFLEPWRCNLEWKMVPVGTGGLNKRYSVAMETQDVINFNLTSSLIELYKQTLKNWTEDYYLLQPLGRNITLESTSLGQHTGSSMTKEDSHQVSTPPALFRRRPFVPFALKNETGSTVWFATQTKMATSTFGPNKQRHLSLSSNSQNDLQWNKLESSDIVPFTFEVRGKMRHFNSHDIKVNQLIVRVEGWQEVSPVSVDRVGTYFREATAVPVTFNPAAEGGYTKEIPPARIVFQVKLEGTARKLITVRSALLVSNLLPYPLELNLVNTALKTGDIITMSIKPKEILPIPLHYVWARIFARPASGGIGQWKYSQKHINWYHIMTASDNSMDVHTSSHSWNTKKEASRFCVSVKRLNYPLDTKSSEEGSTSYMTNAEESVHMPSSAWIQPGHTITFLSPIIIENLLPCHLRYQLKSNGNEESGCFDVVPGKQSCLSADISNQTILAFSLEIFPGHADLNISPGVDFEKRLKFLDNQSRNLYLSFKVEFKLGGAIHICVYSRYWLVNKTGLPLIFKEESGPSETQEAAGQEDEHEGEC